MDTINVPIQVNGKLRATVDLPADVSEADAVAAAMEQENVKKWLEGNAPKR